MRNKISCAVVIASPALQKLIVSTLRDCDIICFSPLPDDKKYLLPYVRENVSEIGSYDAVILDLGALSDSDEQIMEAIEAIRYFDDAIRLIVLAGGRSSSFSLLKNCFLNGIYNLILPGKYTEIQQQLKRALLEGLTYKDALAVRNESDMKKNENCLEESGEEKEIWVVGSCHRIGTTHIALHTAYNLMQMGYIVALFDYSGKADYEQLADSYGFELDGEGRFSIDGIDIYAKSDQATLPYEQKAYNYVIYDMGTYDRINSEMQSRMDKEGSERWILCGCKPWETDALAGSVGMFREMDVKYVFNFTPPIFQKDISKKLTEIGIREKQIVFVEHIPAFFSESGEINKLLTVQRKGKDRKKHLFRRK